MPGQVWGAPRSRELQQRVAVAVCGAVRLFAVSAADAEPTRAAAERLRVMHGGEAFYWFRVDRGAPPDAAPRAGEWLVADFTGEELYVVMAHHYRRERHGWLVAASREA